MGKNRSKGIIFKIILSVVLVIIDLVTKSFFDGKNIVVLDGIFSFTSSHNTGAAFSFLSENPTIILFVSIAFIIILACFGLINKDVTSKVFGIGYVLILSGAIGNLFDRLYFGYVRDFISLDIINFAIFNFADMCLTIGVGLVIIYVLFIDKKDKA